MSFDLIVVGAGPGGYVCAIRAAQLGLKVACVEKDKLGGICLNWGCIPTKALLKGAELVDAMGHAGALGITPVKAEVDITKMVKHSRSVAHRLERGVAWLLAKNEIEHIVGSARLTGPGQLEVEQEGELRSLEAKHIVLATGARPRVFPGIEPDGEVLWSSREALTPSSIPQSLVVLGAGAIGCEFAWFYRTLGTTVTLVEAASHILPSADKEVSQALAKSFSDQDIECRTDTRCTRLLRDGDTAIVHLDGPDGPQILKAQRALIGLGVVGNHEELGLDSVGLEVSGPFLSTDPLGATGVEGLWALGDLTGPPALAHRASAQGLRLAEHLAGKNPEPLHDTTIPACTYCQPEVAQVGRTEEQLWDSGRSYSVGRFPFRANGKALGGGHKDGFIKVLVDDELHEILGIHMIGHGVTELVAGATLALTTEVTAEALLQSVHPHPSLSEALMEAVADALGEAVHV